MNKELVRSSIEEQFELIFNPLKVKIQSLSGIDNISRKLELQSDFLENEFAKFLENILESYKDDDLKRVSAKETLYNLLQRVMGAYLL